MINQFRCPTCHEKLATPTLSCPQGHRFSCDNNGVLSLLNEKVTAELAPFAAAIAQKRRDGQYPLSDPAIYDNLPCAKSVQGNKEWRWRCHDLAIVREIIGRHTNQMRQRILDIGAFNGWLSHQLAADGHQVTAVDYFTDPFDGLGAAKHYTHQFQAIQIHLADLSPLDAQFDVVIMNYGLQFFPDPIAYLRQLIAKVAPGGLLIIIGLIIHHNPAFRKRHIAQAQLEHLQNYGRPMHFRPTRAYLDRHDRTRLIEMGLTLHPYRPFQATNLLARLIPTLPWRGYATKHV